jgi:hypothetical protein
MGRDHVHAVHTATTEPIRRTLVDIEHARHVTITVCPGCGALIHRPSWDRHAEVCPADPPEATP